MVTDLHRERERRAQHRFKDTTRQAMLHASPSERLGIFKVLDAVDAGHMSRDDAHEAFRCLQRGQQAA